MDFTTSATRLAGVDAENRDRVGVVVQTDVREARDRDNRTHDIRRDKELARA